ncbi:MAG: response regulator [Burkholderiales bacterium]|nr:response regulator [Burkholderiales bacterium]
MAVRKFSEGGGPTVRSKLHSHRIVARNCLAGIGLAALTLLVTAWLPPMRWSALHTSMLSLHLLLELAAIVIAVQIVAVSWQTFGRRRGGPSNLLITGFLVVAVCDAVHALTYEGMPPILGPSGTERAIFYWLMGRSAEVGTLGLLALGWRVPLSRNGALWVGVLLSVLLLAVGSRWLGWFPTTFVPGQGVTSFKAAYEVTLFATNLLVALLLWRRAVRSSGLEARQLYLLATSAAVIGIGELAFTAYVTPSDYLNIFGHLYKLAAYLLLYWATFIISLRAPYDALAETEYQLRSVSNNLPNCVLYQVVREADGTMRFTHVSDAVERVCGVRAEEVLRDANVLYGRVHPDDLSMMRAAQRRSAEQQQTFRALLRFRRGDGVWRWFQLMSAPRLLEDGRICWDGVQMDVTDTQEAEAERRSLEGQLRESQKMESIGTLAGGIAHDFNNILGGMLGNVAMAREDLQRGKAQEALRGLELLQRSCLRARDLVQQILTFSRRQAPDFVPQPLQPLVEEAVALLRSTLPARVSLRTELADGPMQVRADATQIQQVLMNLCTNAWQALAGQPGHIDIGLARETLDTERARQLGMAPGEHVHLWVRDDGCGMDEATRLRVFEPFFTTKALGEGTGLGLSVVHGIVRAHKGAMTVDSAPQAGSTFHVWLPIAEPSPPPRSLPACQPADASPAHRGRRVMYVDDDEVMRLMVERLLDRAGLRVNCQGDPDAALALLRADPMAVDVVVTDYNMPQRSGLEVAEAVAALRPGLPVIVSSGNLSEDLLRGAGRLGVSALLEKQHTLDRLVGLIEQVLDEAQDRVAPPVS